MPTTRITDGEVVSKGPDLRPGMSPVAVSSRSGTSAPATPAPLAEDEILVGHDNAVEPPPPSDSPIVHVDGRSHGSPSVTQNFDEPTVATDFPTSSQGPASIEVSMRELFVFGMLGFLTLDAVMGWMNRPSLVSTQVAVFSLDRVFEMANAHYMREGQNAQEAQLSTALLYDTVKEEIVRVDALGTYAAILDADAVYGGTTVDVTDVIFERALASSMSLPPMASLEGGSIANR